MSYSVYSALDLWLKAYYPLEFMCVNLSITDRAKEKKGVRLLDQRVRYCRSIGLKVSPADVRCSGDKWIIRDGGLIAPLSNLKGFGTNDVDAVVRNRPYSSVKEFMDKTRLGASKFDILCLGGALDCFGEREYLYNWYHEFYSKQKKKTDARQLSLFDALEGGGDAFEIKTQLSPSDLKALFLEYNGFSMEEDMLRKHSRLFAENKALKGLGEALKERRTKHCLVLCRIRKVSRFTSRSGSDFVKIEITDGDTDASTVMKAGDHAQHERSLKEGNVVILPIQLDDKDGFYVDDLDRYDLKVVERA